MTQRIDIGDGRWLQPINHLCEGLIGTPASTPTLYGYIDYHSRPDTGERCEGSLRVCPHHIGTPGKRRLWTIDQLEPLTLSPSLLCTACGDHGFVREGRWVPASLG